MSRITGIPSDVLTKKLWEMAWEGLISNDRIQVLRKGIENRFQASSLPPIPRGKVRGTRSHFNRWKATRPMAGNWYVLNVPDPSEDLMEMEEIIRDRIRILFQRYGILFREILAHELRELQWPSIFRSLRLMELSGEIIAGHFFEGISGMQFISHKAYREIQKKLPEDSIYWMNATDPASLCGVRIEALKTQLPARIPSTHMVLRGREILLISKQKGRKLEFRVPPEDPDLAKYLRFFKCQLTRRFSPLKRIKVEMINERPAAESPYKEALVAFGFNLDYQGLVLW